MSLNAEMAALTTVTSTPFVFLPGEVRASIYKALFKNYRITINSQRNRIDRIMSDGHIKYIIESTVFGSFSLGILSTCHTVHNEATKYLSSSATILLTGGFAPDRPLASLLPKQNLLQLQLVLFPRPCHGIICTDHLHDVLDQLPGLRCIEIADADPFWVDGRELDGQRQLSEEEIEAAVLGRRRHPGFEPQYLSNDLGFIDLVRKKRGYSVIVHAELIFRKHGTTRFNVQRDDVHLVVVSRPLPNSRLPLTETFIECCN